MKSLIEKISLQADISEDKAKEALGTITSHVKEQFPFLHAIVYLILEDPSLLKKENLIAELSEFKFSDN